MKIKKGDTFICVKTVEMDNGEIAYNIGKFYTSEQDKCITDNQGDVGHLWEETDCVNTYFKRFKREDTDKYTSIDRINPSYYKQHPSGVECIEITKHYDFCIGNAIKYLWRCGLKQEEGISNKDKEIEDINKAIWYLQKKVETLKILKNE